MQPHRHRFPARGKKKKKKKIKKKTKKKKNTRERATWGGMVYTQVAAFQYRASTGGNKRWWLHSINENVIRRGEMRARGVGASCG